MNNIFIERVCLWLKKSGGPVFSPQLIKYCVAMKLFIVVLILSLNVSASVYSQKISLSYKNAPLREVLQSIRKQSGYNFLFNSNMLTIAKPVTVTVNEANIEETLNAIFMDQPFTYKLENKIITIRKKEEPGLFEKVKSFFKSITFSGKVVDDEGLPLPGATIKANGKATLTNDKGEFSLSGVEEGTDVVISFIGYVPVTVKASKTYMNIRLERKAGDLEEQVIKGYYSTTKALNTGNVSTVKAEDLAKNPIGNPVIALEGRVPGLYISQSSGITGAEFNVKLRGQNSIANGNNPLYIVDGVPFGANSLIVAGASGGAGGNTSPFAMLRMDDIERIEVLKDADATAIYGSRGANGVILITTKAGKSGKTKVDVNVYGGAGEVDRKLDLLNTSQYVAMRRMALTNDGITTVPSGAYDLNGQYGDVNASTDWQKVLIGGTAHVLDAQANISGGNEQTQFLFGGGYRRETTVFPGDFANKKGSAKVNLNHQSENKRFKSSLSVSYMNDNNVLPNTDFSSYIFLSPNTPKLYNADGSLNWQNSTWENPLWQTANKTTLVSDNLNSALNLSYEIIKGLNLTTRAGYNMVQSQSSNIMPYSNYDPAVQILPEYRSNSFSTNKLKSWIIEPGINYTKTIGKGKLDALVGATFQQNDQNSIAQYATGFSAVALINNPASATTLYTANYINNRYRYNAFYARIGYNIEDQYILNLTGRRDASSRFGPGKQFANFGAVGAAWIFSKQPLFSNLSFLSFGKLRASYGLTGNDQLPDYSYLSTYKPTNNTSYQGVGVLNPSQLTNPFYGWETVKKLETGLDLGFLKDRILFNVSWYQNRTGNQLVGYSLPDITGFPTIQANLPAVIENKGFEFELTTQNFKTNTFTWTTSANLSIPRNKLVSYPNLAGSTYANRYIVGQPLFIKFLYHSTGIDPISQVYTFKDIDQDNKITSANDKIPVFVGQKYFGGLNNTFTYKGFQLDVFLQFVKQNGYKLISIAPGIFDAYSGSNQPAYVFDNTTQSNATGIQKFTSSYGTAAGNAYILYSQSDAVVTDASFIRLKNVQLSYNLPVKFIKTLQLQNVRIYAQGQNLFTISKFKGLDPEIAGSSQFITLPPIRMVVAGIQVSF